MEPWLESDKSYERRRVVQSLFLLLQYVADYVKFTVSLLTARSPRRGGGWRREGRGAPQRSALWRPLTLAVRIH